MSDFVTRTPRQLGAILRGYRRERQLTQTEIGTRCGLPQAAISLVESDPTNTSLSRIYRILAALDVELVVRPRGSGSGTSEW